MGFDTVIKNGSVVTATDTYTADVAIASGKITAIGTDLPAQNATKILDASGKLVLPGGIDVHTHLDMPFGGTTSADDFETGTRAAAFGGTTTLIDHHASPNAIDGSLSALENSIAAVGCRAVTCYEVTDRNRPDEAKEGLAV